MSYVERALYDYLKHILTSGLRILFSKKFLFFTIILLSSSLLPTLVLWGYSSGALEPLVIVGFELTALNVLKIELAVSLAFIITGLFFGRTRAYVQAGILLVLSIVFSIFSTLISNLQVIEIYGTATIVAWLLIGVLSTYSFSRNFFGNKISGSILFLGKPENEGIALFGGPFLLFYVLYLALTTMIYFETGDWLFLSVNVIVIVFMGVAVTVLARIDDVFFTIIGFYYFLAMFNLFMLAYTVYTARTNIINIIDIALSMFFIIYNAQAIVKKMETKTRKKEEEKREKDEEEGWFFNDLFKIIGETGTVLIIFGILMGFHILQLYVFFIGEIKINFVVITTVINADLFSVFIKTTQIYLANAVLVMILLLYLVFPSFRIYSSPPIYRFNWLPPYEEVKEFFLKAKKGEVNWKGLTARLIKKGAIAGTKKVYRMTKDKKLIKSAARGLGQLITGRAIVNLFRKKDEDENGEEDLEDY